MKMALVMSPFRLSILLIFTSLAVLAFSKNVIHDQTEVLSLNAGDVDNIAITNKKCVCKNETAFFSLEMLPTRIRCKCNTYRSTTSCVIESVVHDLYACFVFKVLPSLYEISVYSRGVPLGTQKGYGREVFCFSNGKICFYTTTKIFRGKYEFCMYANAGVRLTLRCILRDVVH